MRVLIGLFFIFSLYANSLNSILNKIEFSDDLSNQTKQESGGISYIITRYQLDMMQAKYLKDILKTTVVSNNTNRYNLLDPMTLIITPYGTNHIKVYIDDYEVTSLYSENSLYLFSNLRLDFVDHIEIYYISSADKYFSEPIYITIKLYSKNPKRDSGLNLFTTFSSKYTAQAFNYAKDNYFISASKNKVYEKVNNISKNSDTYNVFAKMKTGENNFMFNAIIDKRDAFLGLSMDANPDKSYIENNAFYLGYDRDFDSFKLNYVLSYQNNEMDFEEKPMLIYYNKAISSLYRKSSNVINLLKISKNKEINKNNLTYGITLKNTKRFNIVSKVNNQDKNNGIKNILKGTIFADNKYQYLSNSIFNIGVSYSLYKNIYNDDSKKFNVKNLKIGNTYLYNSQNIFKLFYYHTETTPPDYIAGGLFESKDLKVSKADNYVLSYKNQLQNDYLFELYLFYSDSKDLLIFSGDKGIVNNSENVFAKIVDMRFTKYYNYINSVVLEYFKVFFDNVYNLKIHEKFTILNTHRYKKFDFFENIIYKKITHNDGINDGLDLDLGIKYNVNDNFTISLKGESLLSSRYQNEDFRYDIKNKKFIEPLKTDATPKNIVLSVEIAF